jgi:radical SAM protein with 4Fe4S-binding SPASM domain
MGTNGIGLTKDQAKSICAMPGQISVSFDAMNPDIFRSIRRGIEPMAVLKSLDMLLQAPRHPGRQVGINAVVLQKNVQEIEALASWANGSGLNYISFSRAIRLGSRDKGIAGNDQQALTAIHQARKANPALQVNIHFFDGATTSRWHPTLCKMPENELLVMHNGHVYPCCFATDTDMGHWGKLDWNGPEFTELRQVLASPPVSTKKYPTCAACPLVPPW